MRSRRRVLGPSVALACWLGPAVVIAACPAASRVLVWDREALRAGEAWRWVTGHWVHFGAGHLIGDALACLAAWACLARRDHGLLWRALAWATLVVPGAVLVADPGLGRYGGLSGLAMAAWAMASVRRWKEGEGGRVAGIFLGLGCLAKLGHEWATGAMWWTHGDGWVSPCVVAHVAGVACGAWVGMASRDARSQPMGEAAPGVGNGTMHTPPNGAARGLQRRRIRANTSLAPGGREADQGPAGVGAYSTRTGRSVGSTTKTGPPAVWRTSMAGSHSWLARPGS